MLLQYVSRNLFLDYSSAYPTASVCLTSLTKSKSSAHQATGLGGRRTHPEGLVFVYCGMRIRMENYRLSQPGGG
jgi:hypothetical protein